MNPHQKLAKAKELLEGQLITQADFDEIKRHCLEELGLLNSQTEHAVESTEARFKRLKQELIEIKEGWTFGTTDFQGRPHLASSPSASYLDKLDAHIQMLKGHKDWYNNISKLAAYSGISLSEPPALGSAQISQWLNTNYCRVSQAQISQIQSSAQISGLVLNDPPPLDPNSPNFEINTVQKSVMTWMTESMKAIQESNARLRKKLEALTHGQSPPKTLTLDEVKAIAKRTGTAQAHPTLENVSVTPSGGLKPAQGYTWVSEEADDFRVRPRKLPQKLPQTPLSALPMVDGPVSGPGGFFSFVRLYRIQFKIDAIAPEDPGALVAATSPYQAIAALFRSPENRRIALSWHNHNNILRDMFITYARVMSDFEAADGYEREDLLLFLDVIGLDIEKAMAEGLVVAHQITRQSMLSDSERDSYMPFNSSSEDHVAKDYI